MKVSKFKDECHGQPMLKFIGLRPKSYSLDYEREANFDENGNEVDKPTATKRIVHASKNTAKGVKDSVRKKLSFDTTNNV